MSQTFFLSLPVFLLMGVGVILVRSGRTSEAGETMALRLVIDFFMPCFILRNVLGVEGIGDPWRLMLLIGVGFGATILQIWAGLGIGRAIGLDEGNGRRTFGVSTGILNYGFLPIPIIQGLFGPGAVLASLLVLNVGFELAVWTVGVSLYGGGFSWKRLVNMPVIALILALGLNLSGIGGELPDWVDRFLSLAGAPAIPLGIVIAGMSIGHPSGELNWQGLIRRWKVSSAALFARLALFPVALLGLAFWAKSAGIDNLAAVLGVHAAMPVATMPVVLARHFGGHPPTAIQICVLTTAVSLVTTPLWLDAAGRWLGW